MDLKALILLLSSVLLAITARGQNELRRRVTLRPYPQIPFVVLPVPKDPSPPSPPNRPATTLVMPLTITPAPSSSPKPKTSRDCYQLCDKRCKSQTNKKVCRKSCMACCDRCKCVPPGDYGTNLDKCGKCYTDMTYHGHKCP